MFKQLTGWMPWGRTTFSILPQGKSMMTSRPWPSTSVMCPSP